jgi:hypothetical protein
MRRTGPRRWRRAPPPSCAASAHRRCAPAPCLPVHLQLHGLTPRFAQVNALMATATGGEWTRELWARTHATEQSKLYKRYVSDAKADAPPPGAAAASGGDSGAGASASPSDSGDGAIAAAAAITATAAAAAGPAPLSAEMLVPELLKLFTAAKGMSHSVLLASQVQERRGGYDHHGGRGGDTYDEVYFGADEYFGLDDGYEF